MLQNSPLKLHYRINILNSMTESFGKLTLSSTVEEKSSQPAERLTASDRENRWKEIEEKSANLKASTVDYETPSLVAESTVKTSDDRVSSTEALTVVSAGATAAASKVHLFVSGMTNKSAAALPSPGAKCKLSFNAATTVSSACTTTAVHSTMSLPKLKSSHIDHRKVKSTKIPVSNMNPVVTPSTEKIQSSPIKSYLTISSILNEPEPKKMMAIKSNSVRKDQDEIKKLITNEPTPVVSSSANLKPPGSTIQAPVAVTSATPPTTNSLTSIVKLLTTSAPPAANKNPNSELLLTTSTKPVMTTSQTSAKCSKSDAVKPVIAVTTQAASPKCSQSESAKQVVTSTSQLAGARCLQSDSVKPVVMTSQLAGARCLQTNSVKSVVTPIVQLADTRCSQTDPVKSVVTSTTPSDAPKCSQTDVVKPVFTPMTLLVSPKCSQADAVKPVSTSATQSPGLICSQSDAIKQVLISTPQLNSPKCSQPDVVNPVSTSTLQLATSMPQLAAATLHSTASTPQLVSSTSQLRVPECTQPDAVKPVAIPVTQSVKCTVSESVKHVSTSTSAVVKCSKPVMSTSSTLSVVISDAEKSKQTAANKVTTSAGTVVSITRSITCCTTSTTVVKSNCVTSPAIVPSVKTQSSLSVPPPLITLTTASATITSTFVATKRPGTPSYILSNAKIPSSLEISVMQGKDKESKTVPNSPVMSLQKMVQQNFTNGNHFVNGVSKQNHHENGKHGTKRNFHDVDGEEDRPAEKYPCLSISKTTTPPSVTAAKEKKRGLQGEISVCTSETIPTKKIFSPNIVPEVSITVNQNPERPKRISPETSYDVSCFKSGDKKEAVTNGVPPLAPIGSHPNVPSFTPKNIPNSPIKNLNKNYNKNSTTMTRHPLLLKGRTKPSSPVFFNNVDVMGCRQTSPANTTADVAKKQHMENGLDTTRVTANGSVSEDGAAKKPSSTSSPKSNKEASPSPSSSKKEGGGGQHPGIPQLIDINTSMYTQLMASQNAKMRLSQPFNNYSASLYVKPPPPTPPGSADNALDLSSPSSKSPTGSSDKSESSPSPEKKKLIPSVPPLMIPVTMSKSESKQSSSTSVMPKIERKVSPITKSDKKASPLGKHPEFSKSSPTSRKTDLRLACSSPSPKTLKMSPSAGDHRKSPSSSLVPSALSSKALPAPIAPAFTMPPFPPVLQFYHMQQPMSAQPYDWLCNIKAPLPLHPNMHERGNPATLQESLRNLKK